MRRNYLPLRIISRAPKQELEYNRGWGNDACQRTKYTRDMRTSRRDTRSRLHAVCVWRYAIRKWHRDSQRGMLFKQCPPSSFPSDKEILSAIAMNLTKVSLFSFVLFGRILLERNGIRKNSQIFLTVSLWYFFNRVQRTENETRRSSKIVSLEMQQLGYIVNTCNKLAFKSIFIILYYGEFYGLI